MTLKQIAGMGRRLVLFLNLFTDCFGRCDARALMLAYVKGQLSGLKRKNCEAIAVPDRIVSVFFAELTVSRFWGVRGSITQN